MILAALFAIVAQLPPLKAPAVVPKPASASVTIVRVPNGGIQPQIAVGVDGRVHLVYFRGDERGGDLFYASSDDGEHFSKPLRVNSHDASAVAIGSIRGAQLALGKDGRVHVAWNGSDQAEPKAPGGATPMLYTRSNDATNAFEPERNVVTKYVGLDGGGSIAADAQGNVYVMWHAPIGDAKGAANRAVCIARSRDDGRTFEPEFAPSALQPLGACECCGLKCGTTNNGTLWGLYRTARGGRSRDMCCFFVDEAGLSSDIVSHWEIEQCVMSSASLAVGGADSDPFPFAAWEERGKVICGPVHFGYADDARIWRASPPGAATAQKFPSLALDAQRSVLLAWSDGAGWANGGKLGWQVFSPEGAPLPDAHGGGQSIPTWSFSAAYARPNGRWFVMY